MEIALMPNAPENKKVDAEIDYMVDAYQSAIDLGAKSIVFHIPKETKENIGRAFGTISNTIIQKFKKQPLPMFLFEIRAMKPTKNLTYESADAMNLLCKEINKNSKSIPWGICIDTSHQWAGGIDMRKDWDKWLDQLNDFTRSKIAMFHLNGNNIKHFGTGKDVHEIVMSPDDDIWKSLISDETREFLKREHINIIRKRQNLYTMLSEADISSITNSSLGSLLKFAKNGNIPIICEIKRGEYIYTRLLMDVLRVLA